MVVRFTLSKEEIALALVDYVNAELGTFFGVDDVKVDLYNSSATVTDKGESREELDG